MTRASEVLTERERYAIMLTAVTAAGCSKARNGREADKSQAVAQALYDDTVATLEVMWR